MATGRGRPYTDRKGNGVVPSWLAPLPLNTIFLCEQDGALSRPVRFSADFNTSSLADCNVHSDSRPLDHGSRRRDAGSKPLRSGIVGIVFRVSTSLAPSPKLSWVQGKPLKASPCATHRVLIFFPLVVLFVVVSWRCWTEWFSAQSIIFTVTAWCGWV